MIKQLFNTAEEFFTYINKTFSRPSYIQQYIQPTHFPCILISDNIEGLKFPTDRYLLIYLEDFGNSKLEENKIKNKRGKK